MEEEQHRGLGLGMSWAQQQPVVVDPKLAAGRGAAFSAAAAVDDDVGPLEDAVPVHFYPGGEQWTPASTSTALDASNKGFQLLQKMGWRGKGLGKNEDGIVEPVAAGVDAGVRLGLGKQAQDDEVTAAAAAARKRLEVEIQADEAPERRERREAQALREQQIKEDVTQILKTFYCQVCSKQYQTAMEMEEHLSSYDHHHKKRLAEARAAEMERTRDERARKEQRRQAREQQRLEEQIRKAQAAAAAAGGQQQAAAGAAQLQAPPPPRPAHGVAAGDGGGGGWGWSTAAADAHAGAPPPPPPEPAQPGASGWSAGGWSAQPAGAAAAGAGSPPPPPPPAAAAAAAQPPPPAAAPPLPPPQAGAAGCGMKFGLKASAPAVLGRGGPGRGAAVGLAAARGARGGAARGGLGGRGRGAAAAALFGESSSDEEGA